MDSNDDSAATSCQALPTVANITEHDILSGRGKSNANHIGNVLFQALITENCDSYINALTQKEKKDTCDRIIHMVRGRFLRFDVQRNSWTEMDVESTRTKVAQAFQYRQRRLVQKETPDEETHDSPKDRKRKLSEASFPPDHVGNEAAMHLNQRIPQPLEVESNTVTLDEIRWVLGVQSSLPQQQSHQQQRLQPQQPQQMFHSSGSRPIPSPGDNLDYADDYAIGIPATMRSRQNEHIPQLIQPINDMNDYVESMRLNIMSQSTAGNESSSTANFLMQSHFQQQARLIQEQEQSQIASAAQNFHVRQAVQQNQNLNWAQNQPDVNVISSFNPNSTIWPNMHSSQSIDPCIYRQSMHAQGMSGPCSANVNVEHFGNPTSSSAASFQQGTGNLYNIANAEDQRRIFSPTEEQSANLTLQQQLFIDPLPLDENEFAESQDKVMERMDRNNKDRR